MSQKVIPPPSPDPASSAPSREIPGRGEAHLHRLVVLVRDQPGVLNRVASLMRARAFNIDSLAVSRTDRPGLSRMTISLRGDDVAVEQAAKQLYRLIDVLKVADVSSEPTVEYELALIKVQVTENRRAQLISLIEISGGRLLDLTARSAIVEIGGSEAKVDELIGILRLYGIRELVRTGVIVMSRGVDSIEEAAQ